MRITDIYFFLHDFLPRNILHPTNMKCVLPLVNTPNIKKLIFNHKPSHILIVYFYYCYILIIQHPFLAAFPAALHETTRSQHRAATFIFLLVFCIS